MKLPKLITFGVPLVVTGCFCVLSSFSWGRVVADQAKGAGYTAKERQQLAALLTPTKPVILTKGGHVIYDSKTRAEIIGLVWNVTPDNMDAFKRWGF